MRFYKEIDFLPKPPDYFDWTLKEIETLNNGFAFKDFAHTFACYDAPKELHDFYQPYFDFPINVGYQVIKKKVPVHKDIGIEEKKWNYILTTGGDNVATNWWDSGKIVESIIIKKNVWHSLQVNVPHDITEVYSPRISISIF